MPRVAGVDPGKQGRVVVLDLASAQAWAYRLAYDKAGELDTDGLWAFLNSVQPTLLISERVQGRKGLGATQTFSFGFACGELNAALAAWCRRTKVPRQQVKPQAWQKLLHEGTPAGLKAKERTLLAYERLFPHDPVPHGPKGGARDDNVIDALMLAFFGVLRFAAGELRTWVIAMHDGGSSGEPDPGEKGGGTQGDCPKGSR